MKSGFTSPIERLKGMSPLYPDCGARVFSKLGSTNLEPLIFRAQNRGLHKKLNTLLSRTEVTLESE